MDRAFIRRISVQNTFLHIPFSFLVFNFFHIDDDQTIDTVVESWVDIEIEKGHSTGLAQLGVLLEQRRHGSPEICKKRLELFEIQTVVITGKGLSQRRQGLGKLNGLREYPRIRGSEK